MASIIAHIEGFENAELSFKKITLWDKIFQQTNDFKKTAKNSYQKIP